MRLWTLHPKYLDAAGLVAFWREALLARRVLEGGTRGYRSHPQLERFRGRSTGVIAAYLAGIVAESLRRGYSFDRSRVPAARAVRRVAATEGQLLLEWRHLRAKLRRRNPAAYRRLLAIRIPEPHPLFRLIPGPPAAWERRVGGPRPPRK